jgi:FkbM family methyltransferase
MQGISYFFKLKFYLGTLTAIRVYLDKCIRKTKLSVPFIRYPFRIRYHDSADNQIFNEVILKRSYFGIGTKGEVLRIVDLGGNIGLSAISFLSEYPKAQVAVVEPDLDNFKLLQENTKPYNEHEMRVHHFNTAIYNREAELFFEDPQVGSHGYRVSESKGVNYKSIIQTLTVNNLLDKLGWDKVDIIKIDIEGAEKELFESNTDWIGRTRYLIIETHDRFKNDSTKTVFHTLENFSYKMKVLNQNLIFKLEKRNEGR